MKITIVTVCKNCSKTIENTILSVLEQDYKNIEYIIVDGMSNDGTYEIVHKFEKNAIIIHEPDQGIYDAMNKGIHYATGKYIYFLNSGDVLQNQKTIGNIVNFLIKTRPDMLCGNVNYIYSDGEIKFHNYTWINMLNPFFLAAGLTVCHQAIFVKTEIMKSKNFDISYTLWADQDFIAYCLKQKFKVALYNEIICNFDAYGFSSGKDKKYLSRLECDKINRKYNFRWYFLFWLPKKIVRLFWK